MFMCSDSLVLGEYFTRRLFRHLSLVVGGEACLWTEYTDTDDFMYRLWYVLFICNMSILGVYAN